MAVKVQNPFESSFENLTKSAQSGVKQVQKQMSQGVGSVVSDMKQQITGGEQKPNVQQNSASGGGFLEQLGLQKVPAQQKADDSAQQQQQLAHVRQNLQKLNEDIEKVRRERIQREQEKRKSEQQEQQKKKSLEEQKKSDPIWKKMLKGSQGAHEGNKHVSG